MWTTQEPQEMKKKSSVLPKFLKGTPKALTKFYLSIYKKDDIQKRSNHKSFKMKKTKQKNKHCCNKDIQQRPCLELDQSGFF